MNRGEFDALYRRGAECCWESFNQMQQRVLELEGRLKQNSNNSHRPPSPDIAKAKRKANNSRVRSGRKPGAQPGHRGHTLKLVANPDHIFVILPPPCTCGHCFDGSETTLNLERRQVVDIPRPAIETTEFRARTLQCANCGQSAKGIFPEHVNAPVQYGPNIRTLCISLHIGNFVPYGRTAELINDMFAIRISVGTLRNIVGQTAVQWSLAMKRHLQLGKRLVDEAKLRGDRTLSSSQLNRFRAAYRKIIKAGRSEMPPPAPPPKGKRGRPARGKALCLLDRLDATSAQILSFMTDFEIPFDNNQAERDIRMDKLKQKNSEASVRPRALKIFVTCARFYPRQRSKPSMSWKRSGIWSKAQCRKSARAAICDTRGLRICQISAILVLNSNSFSLFGTLR